MATEAGEKVAVKGGGLGGVGGGGRGSGSALVEGGGGGGASSFGSGSASLEVCRSSDEEICICNRPRGLVVCRRCGFQDSGRVRTPCPKHRNRHALMDLQLCPLCRAYSLKEISLA